MQRFFFFNCHFIFFFKGKKNGKQKTKRKSSSYNQPIRDGIGGTSKRAMEIEREREREKS
jgi:hypothetical protein